MRRKPKRSQRVRLGRTFAPYSFRWSSSDITMVRGAKLPDWPTFLYSAVVIAPVSAFAFWTIACHVCVIFHLPFYALAKVGPIALGTGLALGIYVARLAHLPGPAVDETE